MKITKLFVLAVSILAVQSVFALNVEIKNMSADAIEVEPLWNLRSRSSDTISSNGSKKYYCPDKLRGLRVKCDGEYFYYNFENYGLRGTGTIVLEVGGRYGFIDAAPHGYAVRVQGSTDMVRKDATRILKVVGYTGRQNKM